MRFANLALDPRQGTLHEDNLARSLAQVCDV
jgi:hypothetical protein